MMKRSWIFLPLVVMTLGAILAGEPEPPGLLLRERTVYIPYEKLKETFEKEGRGIFLPYEEFLKLWNAAQPKEKPPEEVKPPADAVIAGGSYIGIAKETAVRFEVTYKVKALGKNWSELLLPLKNVAVESVTLSDPGAVFAPRGDGYVLILPKPGEYTLTLAFSVRVDSKPGQRRIEFGIPPTAVSRLELTIPEKDLRVEVTPKMAATIATPEGNNTKVLAFVGNADQVTVTWMPPASRIEKGESITIASQNMQVLLGERMLRLDTNITYKIERNEEDTFRVKLPADMRLLWVKGNNIREWTTEAGVLVVRLHSASKDNYALSLRLERILESTPEKLDVPFPVVTGALREDGFVTLVHEAGLRVRVENSTGLSQVDPRELPEAMRQPNLLAAFRYLAHPLSLSLQIQQVKAQIQSAVTAVISIGPEEDTLTGWVEYTIAKVGVFAMKLKIESRWEPVSIGDPQTVEDFQIATEGAYKILTVNLKNKALGTFRLPFKLSGPSRAAPGQITVETIQVLDTQQDKGVFGISAPKAFKLTTIERSKSSSADVRLLVASGLLSTLAVDFDLPLAYTYTQQPASVKIALERRQTEIRVTGYHTVIVGEAVLEMQHKLDYFIEYAGVDRLLFSLPSIYDDNLLDVKCPGFKEKKKLSSANGRSTWEILLQEKVLGAVPLTINHKENLKGLEPEKPQEVTIPDVRGEEIKAQQGYIAVRKESAIEIQPKAVGLEPLEAVNLPGDMRSSNVYLAFRYFQPERSLILKLTRHIPLELASTMVDLMRVTFVVSEEKKLVVRTDLWIQNPGGEQYLELGLPAKAVVRALAVNGASITPQRKENGGTLVKLSSAGGPFPVQIIYALPLDKDEHMGWAGTLELATLELLKGVPVNKIEAELYVPDDYAYLGFSGTLHPRDVHDGNSNTLDWIITMVGGHAAPNNFDRGDARHPQMQQIVGSFTTQGRIFRFQTLAPQGTIKVSYIDRKLFWLLNVIVFIAALAIAWHLTRRRKFPALWVALGCLLPPLCLMWFVTSDMGAPFAAWFLAGIIFAAATLLSRGHSLWSDWREASVAMAPDPFLEEAPERSTYVRQTESEPRPIDGEEPPSTPTSADGEPPPPFDSGDSPPDSAPGDGEPPSHPQPTPPQDNSNRQSRRFKKGGKK